jgi:hypothetical protein
VLNHTDVLEEYFDIMGLDKRKDNVFYFREYKKFINDNVNKDDWQKTYVEYLVYKRNNFIIRLLFCPLCLSVWLSFINCVLLGSFQNTLVVAFFGCLGYFSLHYLVKNST